VIVPKDVCDGDRVRSPLAVASRQREKLQNASIRVGKALVSDRVTKPFSPRELLARIRAVLRRCRVDVAGPVRADTPRAYRFGGWELNVRLYRLNSPDGRRVEISRGEIGLLRALLSSPQRILTRDQLLALTHIDSAEVYDRSIDTQILRLRRKIEADPAKPRFIRTERGTGYYFDAPVSAVR